MISEHHASAITIPPIWKMAALLQLCPQVLREQAMQQINEIGEDYDKLRQKIISWCSNKTEQDNGGPKPMDIGNVQEEGRCQ